MYAIRSYYEQGTASSTGLGTTYPVSSYDEIGAGADLAVVLGGDGGSLSVRSSAVMTTPWRRRSSRWARSVRRITSYNVCYTKLLRIS